MGLPQISSLKKTILFSLILLLRYSSLYSSSVVVILDNSASMNSKQENGITQCTSSNYALQMLISSLGAKDTLYIIYAQRAGQELVTEKYSAKDIGEAINTVKEKKCSDASMLKPLYKGIEIFNSIKDKNKRMVLIGDGEWFIEEDKINISEKNKLISDIKKISDNHKIDYINTSNNENLKNDFLNEIILSERLKSEKNINIIYTNGSALELMKQIEILLKQLLHIPNDGFKEYQLIDNKLLINNRIPLKKIFIIDQYINNTTSRILKLDSKVNKIKIINQYNINKDKLNAVFYEIGNNESFIKEDEIKITFDKAFGTNRMIKVYAVPAYENPIITLDTSLLINGVHKVCKNDKEFQIIYKISHDNNTRLKDNEVNLFKIEVVSLSRNKRFLMTFNKEKQYFLCNIPLTESSEESYKIISKIPNYYYHEEILKIKKRNCLKVKIQNRTDTIKFSLADTAKYVKWFIPAPAVYNAFSDSVLTDEFEYIDYKFENTKKYKLNKTDKGFVLTRKCKRSNFILGSCFCSVKDEHLTISLSHNLAVKKAKIHLVVRKENTGIFNRCYKFIVFIILCILLIWYINKIVHKPRFKKGLKGGYARIIILDDRNGIDNYSEDKIDSKILKTSFFNRYLNPFGPERKKVYGLLFSATRGQSIILLKKSINDSLETGIYGTKFRKEKNKKGKYVYVDTRINENDIIYNTDKRTYYKYKINK